MKAEGCRYGGRGKHLLLLGALARLARADGKGCVHLLNQEGAEGGDGAGQGDALAGLVISGRHCGVLAQFHLRLIKLLPAYCPCENERVIRLQHDLEAIR